MRPDVTLVGTYPPRGVRHGGASGVASYTANLAHALSDRGARVAVVAPEEAGEPSAYSDGKVHVRRRFQRGPNALRAATDAAAEIGSGVNHVQFEMFLYGGPTALAGVPVGLRGLRKQAPTVLTLHQVVGRDDIDRDFTSMHRVKVPAPVARWGLAGVQSTVSRLVDRTIVHEGAFARVVPGATVIPHGVELATSPSREVARRQLGLNDGALTVLCFGFVAPYKGLEAALVAASLLPDEVELVIAGGEHPRLAGRDSYFADLRAQWHDVARFTGFVPNEDVAAWFAATDVALFAYPRPFAASGALALALAYDTPVLLSPELADATGAPELATPTDPFGLASRLRALAADRSALVEVAAATRQVAVGREWPAVADAHVDLYEEVIDGTAAARGGLWAGQSW